MGHNASLALNFNGGQLEINLQSNLSEAQNSLTPFNQKPLSARARRRKRRREARNSQPIFEENSNVTDDCQSTTNQSGIIQNEVIS